MLTIPSSWNTNNNSQIKSGTNAFVQTSEPAEVRANENILRFKYEPQVNAGTLNKAQLVLRVVNNVTVGSVITLSFSQASITITASLTPSFDEFWTETATTNLTYRTLVAESIANELNSSLAFSNDYIINSSADFIYIYAKNFGDEYDLTPTLPASVVVSSNISGDNKFVYEQYVDYSLFVDVYVADEHFGESINKQDATFIDSLILPASGTDINVNVGGLIKDFCDVVLPNKPSPPGLTYKMLDVDGDNRVIRPYFLVYGDYFRYVDGGEKKKRVIGTSSVRWAQNAAMDYLLPYTIDVWSPKTSYAFNWLTSCPQYKEVVYESLEYLQTIVRKTSASIDNFGLAIKLNFYDGNSYSYTQPDVAGYSNLTGNMSIDVSPLALDIKSWEDYIGKQVDTYEVKLYWRIGSYTYTSQPKYYKMIRQCNDEYKHIIWLNEFGAWDSMTFRSNEVQTATKATNLVNRALPFNANTTESVDDEVTLVQRVTYDRTYSVTTGLISNAHYKWMSTLLKSSSVFIYEQMPYDSKEYNFRSIIITDTDFNADSARTEQSLSISYRYTVSEATISR